jgi:phage shock protein PspC (stress-responsive transcriptional regulator)
MAPRPPLRRVRNDRVLAGVAGGFARWLGIDPVIVRVVLVVLALFGGSGLLLYLVGWLLIPEEGDPTSEAEKLIDRSRQPGSSTRTVLIVIGVVLGVILLVNLPPSGPCTASGDSVAAVRSCSARGRRGGAVAGQPPSDRYGLTTNPAAGGRGAQSAASPAGGVTQGACPRPVAP